MVRLQITHYRIRMANLVHAMGLTSLALALAFSLTGAVALAAPMAQTAAGLGQAATFSVIGKAGVTNTGPSVLSGNVGADSSIIGFGGAPDGTANGLVFAPEVNGPESDAATADGVLTSQAGAAAAAGPNLTGLSLVPGVYTVGSALLPGELTLDGPGVYIFLASDLTASGNVTLTNGADACNVFWHVDSAATITGGSFVGTIIAGTSVTFGDAASLDGRAIALTGNVTLINNVISGPSCAAAAAAVLAATSTPDASAAATTATAGAATAGATATPLVLVPVTGVDRSVNSALALRSWLQIGLVVVGMGLMLLGYVLRRE